MDEETAAEVIRRAKQMNADLNDMVWLAMDAGVSEEDFNQFRRRVGRVMGEVYDELLRPLFDKFPHLTPPELIPPRA